MFVGLDLSLTASGFAVRKNERHHEWVTLKTTDKRGPLRLAFIRDQVGYFLDEHGPIQGVAIEGYAFGAKFAREAMGELGGVVRTMLYERGVPYLIVPPTSLKKYATGSGGGDKGNVMVAVFKNYGAEGVDNNQADAIVLSEMAHDFFVHEGKCILKYQTDALEKAELVPGKAPEIRTRQRA